MPCQEHGVLKGRCGTCYMRTYRADPARKKAHREAVKRYEKANPEKRRRWVITSEERRGRFVPEALHALRLALKNLSAAITTVANPEHGPRPRRTSSRRLHQAAERRDRLKRGR